MTAATQDLQTPRVDPIQVLAPLLQVGVEAATTIYAGTMVMVKPSDGYAVPAAAATSGAPGLVIGICNKQKVNTTAAGFGAAGALQVEVDRGAFFLNLNADSTVTIANFGANVFASDDNTVSLSDGGGTRPYAGYLLSVPTTPGVPGLQNGGSSTKVAVQVGQPNPWAAIASSATSLNTAYRTRNVVTSLQAYGGTGTGVLTETSNGAWATQDGVTNAVGDIVLIPEGTTNLSAAADAGPWQITSLGGASAKWVLTRPDWWEHGSPLLLAAVIQNGGEGTLFPGTAWKSFAAQGSTIDTTAPALYPDFVAQQVTLASGTNTISNVPIRSSTKTTVGISRITATTASSTVQYNPATLTAGVLGTASLVVNAQVAAGTINASDGSTLNVGIENW